MISAKWLIVLNLTALVLSVFAAASWWSDLVGQHTAALITGIMSTTVSAMNLVLNSLTKPQGVVTRMLKWGYSKP